MNQLGSKHPSKLGLGCSRLGSINGLDWIESKVLINAALDLGVTLFDTASIYGQGDSEKALGEVIGSRADCLICTKGGKFLPFSKRLVMPAKRFLRFLARRSNSARRRVAVAREGSIPTQWGAKFLEDSIERSLHRLKRECIDIYLLHSVPAEVLEAGSAISVLERAKLAGKVNLIGASVDSVAAAKAALRDDRVKVLQVPLWPGDKQYQEVLEASVRQGVAIMAREVLGGKTTLLQSNDLSKFVSDRMSEVNQDPRIEKFLLGTTSVAHLEEADQCLGRPLG